MLFDVGDRVRASVLFELTDGTDTDPTTVSVSIEPAGADVITYVYPATIVKDATGAYHVDMTLTHAGRWWVSWTGTGALTAAGSLNFLVNSAAE